MSIDDAIDSLSAREAERLKARLEKRLQACVIDGKDGAIPVRARPVRTARGHRESGGEAVTIETLRALLAEATPGPYRIRPNSQRTIEPDHDGHSFTGVGFSHDADAALFVAAVNALPALLDVAEAARAVAAVFDPSCANGNMHDAIKGRPIDFGRGGYEGGLRDALTRLDAP